MIWDIICGICEFLLELLCDIGWLFDWGSSKRKTDEQPNAESRPQFPDLEPRQ